MKKGVLVEQIYLAVSSGKLSDDINVHREDIRAYLSPLISYAIEENRREQVIEQLRMSRARIGSIVPDPIERAFMTIVDVELSKDEDRSLAYGVLPSYLRVASGPIGDVFTIKGKAFEMLTSFRDLDGIEDVSEGILFAWKEKHNQEDRLYIKNYKGEKVKVQLIVSAEALDDDAEVPIPAGKEVLVIEMATEFFRRQRYGADYIIDGRDEKADQATA